jgi:transcriptional regulator with XRE-family HTH domain
MAKLNLRALRGEMSALELSLRSCFARNTIAALEAGVGIPTLDTLYALADALKVPLSDLLERPPAGPRVVRAGEGAHVEGAALDAHLNDRGAGYEIYAIRFHAGGARHAQPHPFGVEEHLHVHSGRVRVGPENAPVELGPGDFARYSGAVPHIYEALGGEAAGTLVITT